MIWPILFPVLYVVLARGSFYQYFGDFWDRCKETFWIGCRVLVASCVGTVFALFIGFTLPGHWTGPETVQLVSLRDGNGINGHFFLGTGSIDTTQYYFFYKKFGQGYQPGKIAVSDVVPDKITVFEEKRQDGQLKVYTYQFTNTSLRWVALDWPSHKYEFVIPEGSIKKNFVLQ